MQSPRKRLRVAGSKLLLRLRASTNASVSLSSFPYVSGDTFRAIADLEWSRGYTHAVDVACSDFVYCQLDDLAYLASDISTMNETTFDQTILLAHNGDLVPDDATLEVLNRSFGAVYMVNALSEHVAAGIHPLPIGLENLHYQRYGRLDYFVKPQAASHERDTARYRPIEILGSFRIATNSTVREPLRRLIDTHQTTWHEPTQDISKYFSLVRQSTFVLSPPGNGPDCHRTWEALYLGAIPVVLETQMPYQLALGLPILRVPSFEWFLSLRSTERMSLAQSMNGRSLTRSLMPYWCWRLLQNHNDLHE